MADLNELLRLEAQFSGDRLSARQFRHHLRNPQAWLGVLQVGDQVRGYALLFSPRRHRCARLYSLAVDPLLRGRGFGRRLLQAAANVALDRGFAELRLEVRVDNSAAIALYESLGYTRFGQRKAYYEDGTDAWRYRLDLSDSPVNP